MSTLAKQFQAALSNIEPDEDAANAKAAHEAVSTALTADDRLNKLRVNPVLIGSYARRVSIRRVKDVDVFARLTMADSSLRPGEILDQVVDVLAAEFGDNVERQHRSVKVDFPDADLSVDAVIARPCIHHPEHWQIPECIEDDGRASWKETNPTEMTELTHAANATFLLNPGNPQTGIYVPVVKLIRQVRRSLGIDEPKGFYFEVLTYHAFQASNPHETTVAEYLAVVLAEIADRLPDYTETGPVDPTMPARTISTRAIPAQVEWAAARFREASDLAQEALAADMCASAVLWRRLLGDTKHTSTPTPVFPLPDECNSDGTLKTRARDHRRLPGGASRAGPVRLSRRTDEASASHGRGVERCQPVPVRGRLAGWARGPPVHRRRLSPDRVGGLARSEVG